MIDKLIQALRDALEVEGVIETYYSDGENVTLAGNCNLRRVATELVAQIEELEEK